MPYNIELLSIGENANTKIAEVAQILNSAQNEFHFALPPDRLKEEGLCFSREEYHTQEVWEFLRDYRIQAKGHRPYQIAIVSGPLGSDRHKNLFGSHVATDGMAVVTLLDHQKYVDSFRPFLCYYFIRYALSFVLPTLRVHEETRDCFFDFKGNKRDLTKSINSGRFCSGCRTKLESAFNSEIRTAIQKMTEAMVAQHASSTATLHAEGLKGSTNIGIITIREDEFESVLMRFNKRRRAAGKNRFYEHVRFLTENKNEVSIAIARCPEQGEGPANAVAADMIADFAPRWILLVGIAGGFPDAEYTLGDVVLASRVHDFSVSATLETGKITFQQHGGAIHLDVEKLLTHLSASKNSLGGWNTPKAITLRKPFEQIPKKPNKNFYGSKKWQAKVHASLRRNFPAENEVRSPIFKVAPMATSNTLLKNAKLAEQWQTSARHAAAVEMELGGVYLAARYGGDGKTRVLAIRGISDIVGYKRSPDWTAFACHSAAALTHALIVTDHIL